MKRYMQEFERLNVNTRGNAKLQNTETTRFLIWNIPSRKTCPYATEHCKALCYAAKAERLYPDCLPSREKNFQETQKDCFALLMIMTIEDIIKGRAYQGKKIYFRIHESGDFYNVEYMRKWVVIAEHFKHDKRIVFQAYTKSIKYAHALGYGSKFWPKNFILWASVWDDSKAEYLKEVERLEMPIYTAASDTEIRERKASGEKFHLCRCSDCGACAKCYKHTRKPIICKLH